MHERPDAGREAAVVITLDPEGSPVPATSLLATSRTGTMQRELNEAPPEYRLVGITVVLGMRRRIGSSGVSTQRRRTASWVADITYVPTLAGFLLPGHRPGRVPPPGRRLGDGPAPAHGAR